VARTARFAALPQLRCAPPPLPARAPLLRSSYRWASSSSQAQGGGGGGLRATDVAKLAGLVSSGQIAPDLKIEGNSLLHIAVSERQKDLVELLVKKGAGLTCLDAGTFCSILLPVSGG